jgi:hypothetical protein
MIITNRGRSHRRLAGFVDWIKPDPKMRESIREQADSIRQAIKNRARADGLVVVATPNGGSFAKRTGIDSTASRSRFAQGGRRWLSVRGRVSFGSHAVAALRDRPRRDLLRALTRARRIDDRRAAASAPATGALQKPGKPATSSVGQPWSSSAPFRTDVQTM